MSAFDIIFFMFILDIHLFMLDVDMSDRSSVALNLVRGSKTLSSIPLSLVFFSKDFRLVIEGIYQYYTIDKISMHYICMLPTSL